MVSFYTIIISYRKKPTRSTCDIDKLNRIIIIIIIQSFYRTENADQYIQNIFSSVKKLFSLKRTILFRNFRNVLTY